MGLEDRGLGIEHREHQGEERKREEWGTISGEAGVERVSCLDCEPLLFKDLDHTTQGQDVKSVRKSVVLPYGEHKM